MQEDFSVRLERAKLDAMKELAYGASHEINNPLANISARAQALLREEQHPERRQSLEAIYQQAMRAHEMISDLMLFARPPKLNKLQFDLVSLVEEVADQIRPLAITLRVELHLNLPTAAEILADRQQLAVAITALCRNSLEAIGEGGVLEVILNIQEDQVSLEVSDTGTGISDEVRRHIFDPFFSGREAGRGLGFGLSKCWRIVTDHGGSVEVSNRQEGGATFSLLLPVKTPQES